MRRLPTFYIAYRAENESGIAQVRDISFASAKRTVCRSIENVSELWQVSANFYRLANESYLPESGWKAKNRVKRKI